MTSATAPAWPEGAGLAARVRIRFRDWRRTRPFWAGLLAMFAGVPILYFPYAKMALGGMTVQMSTTAGAGSAVIGLLMMALGLSAWFQPIVRVFCGVATTILALISIPVSNLGGFGFGLILGLVAGGLMMSWAPVKLEPVAAEALTAEYAAVEQPAAFAGQPAVVEQPGAPAVEADPAAPTAVIETPAAGEQQ